MVSETGDVQEGEKMNEENFEFEPELGQAIFGQPTKECQVGWELESGLEMIRHYLDIAFDLDGDPFDNSGAAFKCAVFEVESYSWNDEVEQPYNFKWRDLEVSWYKYFGRGMSVNRVPKAREITEMIHECLDELRRMNGEEKR